jgi:hypothetical protein
MSIVMAVEVAVVVASVQ